VGKRLRIEENGLHLVFEIGEDGRVSRLRFGIWRN